MKFYRKHIIRILAILGIIFILLGNIVSIPFWDITHETIKTASPDLKSVYHVFLTVYNLFIYCGEGLWGIGLGIYIFRNIAKKERLSTNLIAGGMLILLISFWYFAPFAHVELVNPSYEELMNGYTVLWDTTTLMFILGIILFAIGTINLSFKFLRRVKIKIKYR